MKVMVDTNAYSNWRRNGEWNDFLSRASEVWMPAIVLGELRAGFRRSRHSAENERKLADFLEFPVVKVAEVTESTTHHYAEFKNYLRGAGTPIPENDVWIAACACEHAAPLLTSNGHFSHLPQVRMIKDR